MYTEHLRRYFFFGLLTLVAVVLFLMFRPFLTPLILGMSLAVVFFPINHWLRKRMSGKANWLAALLSVALFVVIVMGPLITIGSIVLHQSGDLYSAASSGSDFGPFVDKIGEAVDGVLPGTFSIHARERAADLVTFLFGNLTGLFTSTLTTVFGFLLALLTMFYLLKDGSYFKSMITRLSPLSNEENGKIFARLTETINGVVKGYLFIALIQGALSGIGLAIFGVPHAALWGVLAGIASLVPTIGTALILGPAVLYLISIGATTPAIGLGIWGLTIVGMVDNLISPYVIGNKIRIPPLFILFSILGGLALVGPIGFIVGPLCVSLFFALLSIYRAEFQPEE